MKFTNRWSYDVCWRGIRVEPGQTVEDKKKIKKSKKEVKPNGLE